MLIHGTEKFNFYTNRRFVFFNKKKMTVSHIWDFETSIFIDANKLKKTLSNTSK